MNKTCSVIVIKDPKNMRCFSKALVFGLAHLADNQLMFKNYRSHNAKQWNKTAIKLHELLGLGLQHAITWQQMEVAADSSINTWIQ